MDIHKIIERYFDGATTIDEERELQQYLLTHDVPADLQRDKELMLSLMCKPCDAVPSPSFEGRLEAMIDNLATESIADTVEHETVACPKRRLYATPRLLWWTSAAAVILLVVLLAPQRPRPKDTFSSPEEAAPYVMDAFFHVSSMIESGIQGEREVANQFCEIEREATGSLAIFN